MRQSRAVERMRDGVHEAPWRIAAAVVLVPAMSGLFFGRESSAEQAPAPSASSPRAATRPVADLTTRYELMERYTPTEDKERPELIAQYRVAIRETIRVVTENPRGAPDRVEGVAQTIYTERPAKVSDRGEVSAAVRRYEIFKITPDPQSKPSATRPLEGLTLWFQSQPGDDPLVLSLIENRRLRDTEYTIISRQVFLPELAAVLSSMPRRKGDPWGLPLTAIKTLIGEPPLRDSVLSATLLDIRDDPTSGKMVAVIKASGKVKLPSGEAALNAQILFTFAPPAPAPAPGAERTGGDEGTIKARGAITELRLAVAKTVGVPGPDGRIRRHTQTNELVLGRQFVANAPPLAIPDPPPSPTEANSWLTYVDPEGRFHFPHPQNLRPSPRSTSERIELSEPHPGGPDVVTIGLLARTDDPQLTAQIRDPEFHRKNMSEKWRMDQLEAIPGAAGWLPEADWAPSKMKVYRFEAALRPGGRVAKGGARQRIYADCYLVLMSRHDHFFVTATTVKDTKETQATFRAQVEAMIKSFRYDAPTDAR